MTDRGRKYISIAILAIVAIIVFVFSHECIWAGDDIAYQYVIDNESYYNADTEEINTIGDIIRSQNVHYAIVNGRYVAHCLVQLYCGILGKTLFAVSNALVYIVFIIALMKLIGIKLRDVAQVATLTLLVLLSFDTKYVPSCQIGFIWMFTLAVIWLNLFFRVKRCKWWQCVGLFLFGCIVGNSQEALIVGVAGAVAIDAVRNRKEYDNAKWSMAIGLWVGLAILVFAPPTWSRVENNIISLQDTTYSFIRYSWVVWLMAVVVVFLKIKGALNIKSFYSQNSFYIHAGLLLLAMNFYIGIYGNRQLFGLYLMAIILIVKMLPERRFAGWMFIVTMAVCVTHYIDKWTVIQLNKRVYEQIVELFDRSPDGTVYIDMEHNVKTCNPSPYMANRFFFDLGMLKYKLSKDSGWAKNAVVLPKCLKDLKEPVTECQAVEFADGCFVVIMPENSNSRAMLKRYLDIGIMQIPLSDSMIPQGHFLSHYGDTYEFIVVYQDRPLIKYSAVEFVE